MVRDPFALLYSYGCAYGAEKRKKADTESAVNG